MSSHAHFNQFAGAPRMLRQYPGLVDTFTLVDGMNTQDFNTAMMMIFAAQSERHARVAAPEQSPFCCPSAVDQRMFAAVEDIIYRQLPDTPFVELSPLQPLGINAILAQTNQKNILPSLRNTEVNADITTALFYEAAQKYDKQSGKTVHLASNARITRGQTFAKETKFLPHFKMFGQVRIGEQSGSFGPEELTSLADHLADEVAIVDEICAMKPDYAPALKIKIGNLAIVRGLIDKQVIDHATVRRNTITPGYDVFRDHGVDLPNEFTLENTSLVETLRGFGLKEGVTVFGRFIDIVGDRHPRLLPRLTIELGRIAGMGYYRNLAYKLEIINDEVHVPVGDGGTTDWARTMRIGTKNTYTSASGLGTELLCKYVLCPEV